MDIFWIAILFIFAGLLLGGVWIGAALGLIGVIILYITGGVVALDSVAVATWNILENYSYAALPMYIFLGGVFVTSGLASRSYDAISPLFERVPGKLLVSNVVLDAMFGAVVGSSMATAATVGSIAYPELSKRGYNRTALVGNLAGAGTLGSFIPPSLGLIVYASWVEISIGSCFAAVLIPALITVVLFMGYLTVLCSIRRGIVPAGGEVIPLRQALLKTRNVWPIVILIASIMGVIYFGIATAVEAAGIAAVMAIIMSIGFKTFSFKKLHRALVATIRTCGMLLFIIFGASIFSVSLSVIGIPRQVILGVEALALPPILVIFFVYALYLLLGCFFEFLAVLLMTLPFTFPLLMSIGCDPFWFGAVCVITGEMGLLTPPVGLNLYVLQGVTHGEVSMGEVARGSIPYFLLLGVSLALITIFPQLTTWLPAHML